MGFCCLVSLGALLCTDNPRPPAWALAVGEGLGAVPKDVYSWASRGPFIGQSPRKQTHYNSSSPAAIWGQSCDQMGKRGFCAQELALSGQWCHLGVPPQVGLQGRRPPLKPLCGRCKKEVRADLSVWPPGPAGPLWRPSEGPSQEHGGHPRWRGPAGRGWIAAKSWGAYQGEREMDQMDKDRASPTPPPPQPGVMAAPVQLSVSLT